MPSSSSEVSSRTVSKRRPVQLPHMFLQVSARQGCTTSVDQTPFEKKVVARVPAPRPASRLGEARHGEARQGGGGGGQRSRRFREGHISQGGALKRHKHDTESSHW